MIHMSPSLVNMPQIKPIFKVSFTLWIVPVQQTDFKLKKTNVKSRCKDWMSWG